MTFDIAIVGAGIAGASLAAELSPYASVLLLEAEDRAGAHATGRSAAFWEEAYGGPAVTPLTLASGPWLNQHGFLSPRGALNIGRAQDADKVAAFVARFAGAGAKVEQVGRERIAELVPGIRPDWCVASWEPGCADIDVAGLHQHFLAAARRAGAELRVRAGLTAGEREGDGWRLALADGSEVRCGVIVNAAGAWADAVADLCGVARLGFTPLRRSVAQLRVAPVPAAALPLTLGINEDFYFKPESGKLWLSPHDEIPSPPCDAAPEELDIAVAIDRLEQVVDWRIERVEHKWAGLRTFSPDRLPVYGYAGDRPGFFWCAGQGGFGIQTAPAAARMAAQLLLGRPSDAMTEALDPALYAPARFQRR